MLIVRNFVSQIGLQRAHSEISAVPLHRIVSKFRIAKVALWGGKRWKQLSQNRCHPWQLQRIGIARVLVTMAVRVCACNRILPWRNYTRVSSGAAESRWIPFTFPYILVFNTTRAPPSKTRCATTESAVCLSRVINEVPLVSRKCGEKCILMHYLWSGTKKRERCRGRRGFFFHSIVSDREVEWKKNVGNGAFFPRPKAFVSTRVCVCAILHEKIVTSAASQVKQIGKESIEIPLLRCLFDPEGEPLNVHCDLTG